MSAMALATVVVSTKDTQTVQRPILSHLRHYGVSSLRSSRWEGEVGGRIYSVAVTRDEGFTLFRMNLEGSTVEIRLSERNFPDLDLHTIREGIRVEYGVRRLTFEMKYGAPSECFSGDDGRRLLVLSLNSEHEVSATRFDPEDCQVNWRTVDLRRDRSGVYSEVIR